jgi:hypothetical protein
MFLWRFALCALWLRGLFLWRRDASGIMFLWTSGKMFPWRDGVGPLGESSVDGVALRGDQLQGLQGGEMIAQRPRRHSTERGKLGLGEAHAPVRLGVADHVQEGNLERRLQAHIQNAFIESASHGRTASAITASLRGSASTVSCFMAQNTPNAFVTKSR